MKKRFLCLLAVVLFVFPSFIFAHQGVMSGAGKIRMTQTEWFDIIYTEKSIPTARILYEKADDVYRELAAAYGIEPYLRVPVVITPEVEQFNAYQTNSPYNCIVLFDTGEIPDLAVFSETILSTFTHELTHSLTYNHKDETSRALAKVFGDAFAAYYPSVTRGMAEGATVSYESSHGEGRLNDPYALQMVRQAKIEDNFPTYSDVKGSSDAYPMGSFYYFNGGFAEFLQRNFGMDKYAEFWYRCVNGYNLTAAVAFKKTFGIKIDKAWQMFYDRYEIPEVLNADPVAQGQADDFFEPQSKTFSLKNNAGSLYSNLCKSDQGVYYIDETHSSVYFVDAGQLKKGGAVSPKKLFRHDYIDSLSVSRDGRFLIISFYSTLSANIKHKAAIYDSLEKSWFYIEETNVCDPSVILHDGQYYCILQKYESQKYSILVKKILLNKKIIGVEQFATLDFAPEESPDFFSDLGDGTFAFIKKAGLDFSVCVAALDCSSITEYSAPLEGMRIRYLSAQSNSKLAFSWATKETLPRLGFLELAQGKFTLSQENISGGIYYPVVTDDNRVLYTAEFYKQNRLLRLNDSNTAFAEIAAVPVNKTFGADSASGAASIVVQDLPYKPFFPLRYAFDGLLLPVSDASSQDFVNKGDQSEYNMPLGITYITSLPWTADLFMFSAGYGLKTKSGAFDFHYQGGTGTSLFTYSLGSSLEFDVSGFKQTHGSLSTGTTVDFGRRSAVALNFSADADYGRVSYSKKEGNKTVVVNDCKDVYFKTQESVVAAYSNIVSSGPGTYERSGFYASAGVKYDYSSKLKPEAQKLNGMYDFGITLSGRIPKLIPIKCVDGYTYNLPAKISGQLFPLGDCNYAAAQLNAETVLFGIDIQRAVPGVSALFINDAIITLGYTGGFDYADAGESNRSWHITRLGRYAGQVANGQMKYKDFATVKFVLGLTPNVGGFAHSQFRYNLYCGLNIGKKQNRPKDIFIFGFDAKF